MAHRLLSILLFSALALTCPVPPAAAQDGFKTIFDGKSMDGWKANENTDSWQLKDGMLVCHGERSHLFYIGDEKPFKDFHFKAEVKTTKGSNSGIYFHTKYQDSGWPKFGVTNAKSTCRIPMSRNQADCTL